MTTDEDALQLPKGLIEALSGPDSASEEPAAAPPPETPRPKSKTQQEGIDMSDDVVAVSTVLEQEEITVVREYAVTHAPILRHWHDGQFTPARAELTFVWWDYGMSGREWRLTHAKAQGWTGEHPGVTEIDFPTVGRRPDWLNELVNQAFAELTKRKVVAE